MHPPHIPRQARPAGALSAQSHGRVRPVRWLCFVLLAVLGAHLPAWAEKADRDKPIQVESDRMEYDDARRISTFIGRVVLTKGTILIRADRMVVREDNDGYQYGRAEGKPASFRQKREALEEHVEGYGLVIDYDGKAETVVLTSEATLRRLERERVLDEVHGARITYQSAAEFYTVEGRAPGATGADRVRMVIQPRRTTSQDAPAAPAAPPATLRPADSLSKPPVSR